MKVRILILILMIAPLAKSQTLPEIDVQRYAGTWYLIGFKPSKLDQNWIHVQETYTWDNRKNRFDVVANYKTEIGGKQKSATEKLIPVENTNNARWIARIWLFIRADYVIYKIADDYSHVVIGHPKQKYLYIMARKPEMSEELYTELVDFAVMLGYKREEIKKHVRESTI